MMFIVLEGIDGTGKTSLARMLQEYLESCGYRVFLTEEPTKTWLGEAVRRGIREEKNPFTQALLFFADRAEHVEEIKRHLGRGEIVICDRFIYSTYAYQGVQLSRYMDRDAALQWLEGIYAPMQLNPDLVFLLTASPRRGLSRIKDRAIKEKFEREDFLQKVQDMYLYLAEKHGFHVVDSNLPLDEVFEKIKDILQKFL